MAWSSSWSRPKLTLLATSLTRATSPVRISLPVTETTPWELRAAMCSPATPQYTVPTSTPAMSWASRIALPTARVISSMSRTTPRRTPVVRSIATPRMRTRGARTSPLTSPIRATTLVEPRSSAATRCWGWPLTRSRPAGSRVAEIARRAPPTPAPVSRGDPRRGTRRGCRYLTLRPGRGFSRPPPRPPRQAVPVPPAGSAGRTPGRHPGPGPAGRPPRNRAPPAAGPRRGGSGGTGGCVPTGPPAHAARPPGPLGQGPRPRFTNHDADRARQPPAQVSLRDAGECLDPGEERSRAIENALPARNCQRAGHLRSGQVVGADQLHAANPEKCHCPEQSEPTEPGEPHGDHAESHQQPPLHAEPRRSRTSEPSRVMSPAPSVRRTSPDRSRDATRSPSAPREGS